MHAAKKAPTQPTRSAPKVGGHPLTVRGEVGKKDSKLSPVATTSASKTTGKGPFEASNHDNRGRNMRNFSNDKEDVELKNDNYSIQDRSVVLDAAKDPKIKELVMQQYRDFDKSRFGHSYDGDVSNDTEVEGYGHDLENNSDRTPSAGYMMSVNSPTSRSGVYLHTIPEHGHSSGHTTPQPYSRGYTTSTFESKTPSPGNALGGGVSNLDLASMGDDELTRLFQAAKLEHERRQRTPSSGTAATTSSIAGYVHTTVPLHAEPADSPSKSIQSASSARDPTKRRSKSGGHEFSRSATVAAMNAALHTPSVPSYKQFAGAIAAHNSHHEPEDVEIKNAFVANQTTPSAHMSSHAPHRPASGTGHPHEKMFQHRASESDPSTPGATPAAYSSSPQCSPFMLSGTHDLSELMSATGRPSSRNISSNTPIDDASLGINTAISRTGTKSASTTPKTRKLESALRESKQYEIHPNKESTVPESLLNAPISGTFVLTESFTPLASHHTAPRVLHHLNSAVSMATNPELAAIHNEAISQKSLSHIPLLKPKRNVSIGSDLSSIQDESVVERSPRGAPVLKTFTLDDESRSISSAQQGSQLDRILAVNRQLSVSPFSAFDDRSVGSQSFRSINSSSVKNSTFGSSPRASGAHKGAFTSHSDRHHVPRSNNAHSSSSNTHNNNNNNINSSAINSNNKKPK